MDEANRDWRAVSAGLVVMRLIDQLVTERRTRTPTDISSVGAVREAVEEIALGAPVRRVLTSLIDALVVPSGPDLHIICPRLMAYGQTLEYEARWALAADVYGAVIEFTAVSRETDVAIAAQQQLGFARRMLGDFDGALDAYERASAAALSIDDLVGVLRARLGVARIVILRGNMPKAEAMLAETIERARAEGLSSIRASALVDRAYVAGVSQEYERAVEYSYEALDLSESQRQRDRIMNNIATGFRFLGLYDAARDAYLVITATGQEQYVRWLAELNLMELAGLQGVSTEFERIRLRLQDADLSPDLRVTYFLHLGRGYHALGQSAIAIPYLEQAVDLAADYELNQMLFEAEKALSEAKAGTLRVRQPVAHVSRDVEQVAQAIHRLRETAAAHG